jgi:hypothetical protein
MRNEFDNVNARNSCRLRRLKRARTASAFLFLFPLLAYPIFVFVVQFIDDGPERGMVLLPILYYGLIASPLLLVPLIAWVAFHFQYRVLQRRLSLVS